MKKLFGILLLATVVSLFSSCVVVGEHHHEYDITFDNNTRYDVSDWYVKDSDGYKYAKRTDRYVPVYSDETSTIYDLDVDYYRVYFAYHPHPDYCDYYYTHEVFLNDDVIYCLYEDDFYDRAAVADNTEEESKEPSFYLKDSEGNIYPLQKLN